MKENGYEKKGTSIVNIFGGLRGQPLMLDISTGFPHGARQRTDETVLFHVEAERQRGLL